MGETYSRETRIGLVLYGGVSLAIYENGIAQELCRAVRGEGPYSLIKDLIDSDIIVDVISGTSAGGVNGILLGYALANGRDFGSVAELWRKDGDIAALLRPREDPESSSLLQSREFYQKRLVAALQGMRAWRAPLHSRPSTIEELDLFVTGTDVAGRVGTFYDDQGHAIDVKDHRAVFKLSYRAGRKNEFDPDGAEELATLARITSCFPVAFEPVSVSRDHARLQRWGRLDRSAVFLDGGILDNKPFSYAIDTIFRRTATRDVSRFLMYVEPDPERFRPEPHTRTPGVAEAALDALINIPGYESIAGDIMAITARNERITRLEAMAKCVRLDSNAVNASVWDVMPSEPESPLTALYLTARLHQLRNRAVEGILNDVGGRRFFHDPDERRAARILVESFEYWDGSYGDTLRWFDVYYRARRAFHTAYAIKHQLYDAADRPTDPDTVARYRALWRAVNHHIKLLEIVQSAMERYVDSTPIQWRTLSNEFAGEGTAREPVEDELREVSKRLWGRVASGLGVLLQKDGLPWPASDSQEARSAFSAALFARGSALAQGEPTQEFSSTLLLDLDDDLGRILTQFAAVEPASRVLLEFCNFVEIDRHVFPMQFAADTHTRDVIKVVRVSPLDAKRGFSGRPLEDKVCGKTLGAFGGFFKRSWRSNDILWGRLDGACQLIECLLTRARTAAVFQQNGPVPQVERRLDGLFQQTPIEDRAELADLLGRLGTLSEQEFERLLTGFVEAAQREIVAENWQGIVQDALDQECEWSQHATLPEKAAASATEAYAADRLAWRPSKWSPDRLLVAQAARTLGKTDASLFHSYKLAGRSFADEIPKPVLLELGTLAVLRLEQSLSSGLTPKTRRWLQVPFLYALIFRWLLPALYGWARFHRRAPEWRVSLSVAIIAASAAVFGVALVLMFWAVTLPIRAYAMMILGPILACGLWVLFFRRA